MFAPEVFVGAGSDSIAFTIPVERLEQLTGAISNSSDESERVEGFGFHRLGASLVLDVLGRTLPSPEEGCVRVIASRAIWDACRDFTDTWEEPWEWNY